MSKRLLPYGSQWITDDDVHAVESVLRSGWLTTGPAVAEFERGLADYCGAKHAAAVSSGTAALHAAYYGLGLGPGDEIITTPLTFAATANAALYLGADVRFVDVEADTGTLDPSAIESAITERTKLITAIDYAGHPADYDAINAVAATHGLSVVADAAHSLGGVYKGRRVGALADATTLSFHPVKVITTGEGGAVLCNDPEVAGRIADFRNHGITQDANRMSSNAPWHQEMHALGFNYRLSDLQCALGSSQLKRLDAFMARRRAIASRYDQAFSATAGITGPTQRADVLSAWHLYVLRVDQGDRRRPLFERLRALGIGVQVHYIPVHHHPFYSERGIDPSLCPAAVDFSARALSIPIFPRMSDDDVSFVIDAVHQAAGEVL
jgi:UDP-4-amino-4,6-dideoxy-N-acetyl-beta-L-altrosamine transaminase